MGALITQHSSEKALPDALRKLRHGSPVRLKVNDQKSKPSRELGYCLLYIVPVTMFNEKESGFVFAVEGGGCTTQPACNISKSALIKIGLSAKAADKLKAEIARLFL